MNPVKSQFFKIFSYAIVAILLFFILKTAIVGWNDIGHALNAVRYEYLLLSLVMLILGFVWLSILWNNLLKIIEPEKKMSTFKALKIYTYSEFSRYLPGKIWPILGKVHFGSIEGVSKKSLLVSSFINDVLSLIATMVLGCGLLFYAAADVEKIFYLLSIIIITLTLIFVHPKIFYPILNFVLKFIHKEALEKSSFYSYKHILMFLVSCLFSSVLRAAAFYFFVLSFVPVPTSYAIMIMGIYSFATALGVLAVFTPNGLGIKEGMLLFLLKLIIPLSIASFISIISRIWYLMAQVILFVIVYALNFASNRKKVLYATTKL